MKMNVISEDRKRLTEEYEALKLMIKANSNKRVHNRLKVIKLYMDGWTHQAIADKLDYTRPWVTRLIKEYREKGLYEYSRHKYGGNHRSMSVAEEEAILRKFDEKAEKGEIVTAMDIKKVIDDKLGKDTGRGYIYMLLERHKYRKVMPRPKHPKKASDEEIESSKKLT